MNIDISIVWARIGQMLNAVIAALPSILIAFIVFTLFYVSAKGISSSVVHFTRRRQRHRNLGLALGRLSQWVVVLSVGLWPYPSSSQRSR
jgi:small conductance mechanosensitive channel